jgi:hypothetical protein
MGKTTKFINSMATVLNLILAERRKKRKRQGKCLIASNKCAFHIQSMKRNPQKFFLKYLQQWEKASGMKIKCMNVRRVSMEFYNKIIIVFGLPLIYETLALSLCPPSVGVHIHGLQNLSISLFLYVCVCACIGLPQNFRCYDTHFHFHTLAAIIHTHISGFKKLSFTL